jgi:glycosyl hydrolase family 16/phage terminase large subunit GpA
MPTESDARGLMVDDIGGLFAESPALADHLPMPHPGKSDRNTLVHRLFDGGSLKVVAAGAPRNDLSEGFHTFGVNWQQDIIQWYIDGAEVAEAPTPADMHQPMYLLANLAVGGAGSWPGVADASAFPATMSIDYIHVYQLV